MKPVKLTVPLLIEDRHHDAGDVVMVHDLKAEELILRKHAIVADADSDVENPGHNPLADAITPMPTPGSILHPDDVTTQTVEHNPGLLKLAEVFANARKTAKPKAAAPEAPDVAPPAAPEVSPPADPEVAPAAAPESPAAATTI